MLRTPLLTAVIAAFSLVAAGPASAAPPGNDSFGSATTISGVASPADTNYTVANATTESGEPALQGGHTVWFKWTPAATGAVFTDVCGAPSNHYIKAFRVKAGQANQVTNLEPATAGDVTGIPAPSSSFCRARWRATAGTTYYLQVDSGGASPAWSLVLVQDTSAPTLPSLNPNWAGITGPSYSAIFSSNQNDVTFWCNVDASSFTPCTSPHALTGLSDASHTFRVRAMDPSGNLSSIRSQVWKVDAKAPTTSVTSAPGAVPVTFTSSEAGSSTCSVDGGAFTACQSPFTPPALAPGDHTVAIKSTDAYGNAESATAKATWTIAAPPAEQPGGTTPPVTTPPTGEPPVVTTPSATCTLTLAAPKRVTRAALRKGVKVTVSAAGAGCTTKVALKQRGKGLATRTLALTAGAKGTVVLKSRAARRGKAAIVAGAAKRTLTIA